MVLQQRSLLITKASRDVLALFFREDDAVEALVDDMVVVECARVLRDGVDLATERAP